jgi:hypothetical protein
MRTSVIGSGVVQSSDATDPELEIVADEGVVRAELSEGLRRDIEVGRQGWDAPGIEHHVELNGGAGRKLPGRRRDAVHGVPGHRHHVAWMEDPGVGSVVELGPNRSLVADDEEIELLGGATTGSTLPRGSRDDPAQRERIEVVPSEVRIGEFLDKGSRHVAGYADAGRRHRTAARIEKQ